MQYTVLVYQCSINKMTPPEISFAVEMELQQDGLLWRNNEKN